MSKKFYAVNRETGEEWKGKKPRKSDFGNGDSAKEYLMMYDSGYLAVVSEPDGGWHTYITPLDPKIWKTVINKNMGGK